MSLRKLPLTALWLAVGIASCSAAPAAREMDQMPEAGNAGASGAGGQMGAAGGAGSGGEMPGGDGSVEHGGGSGSPIVSDAGAEASDATAEPTSCPAGGTGFTILGDAQELVRDNATCLMWDRSHTALGFQESQQHCQDLKLGAYDDWRMPTVDELYSLVRRNNAGNIDAIAFPNAPGSCWTATQPDSMHSCAVGFDSGGCYKYGNSAGTWGTYCVRGSSTTLPPLSASCKMVCGI